VSSRIHARCWRSVDSLPVSSILRGNDSTLGERMRIGRAYPRRSKHVEWALEQEAHEEMRDLTQSIARRFLICAFVAMHGPTPTSSCAAEADGSRPPTPSFSRTKLWPRVVSAVPQDTRIEARVFELLHRLTLEQKVAQMVQADIRYFTPEDMRVYHLGAILNGGGAFPYNNKHAAVSEWVALADRYFDASVQSSVGAVGIPVMWGTDAVHGHNNVLGATVFPHNIGLGAAHDPDLIERIGTITAEEVAVTGIDWTFAPTVAVAHDDRWGRTYESYSEDPAIVRMYAARMIRGLQGAAGTPSFLNSSHIIATAKHFIGDGGTERGVDRGDNMSSERQLLRTDAQGYIAAIQSGVQAVMASYNSWQGVKVHGQQHLLTEVLKARMGFGGLLVSDWDGIDEVQGCSKDRCARAINAGIDLFMVPTEWRAFLQNTVAQVRAGDIPESRIDDAVSRILRVKFRAGLFEKGRPSSRPLSNQRALLGSAEHRDVAREAVRKSLVLLKNDNGLLPLHRNMSVLVAGDGADNIGKQCGGWTLTWSGGGNSNPDFPGATSIFQGIHSIVEAAGGTATLSVNGTYRSRPDVAIVVFGENPYAEWLGDILSIDYRSTPVLDSSSELRPPPEAGALGFGEARTGEPTPVPRPSRSASAKTRSHDFLLLLRLRQSSIPVVAVFLTGRPMWITPELDASNAFVVAWLPGTEGVGIADVLFRNAEGEVNYDFTGKLSFSWPHNSRQTSAARGDKDYHPLFPYGFGLTYGEPPRAAARDSSGRADQRIRATVSAQSH
jgi:beta-glucosidase